MNESQFWSRKVRPMLDTTRVWAERVENGLGSGMPDVFYQMKKPARGGWIENKYDERCPVRESSRAFASERGRLRQEQVAWWLTFLHYGGRGLLCVGLGEEAWCVPASDAVVRGWNTMTMSTIRALPKLTTMNLLLYL